MINRIPKSIKAILLRADILMDELAQQKDVEDKEKAVERERQSRLEWEGLWKECGPQLPKEIRLFASRDIENIDFDLSWQERAIPIRIKGLAPFIAIFDLVGHGDGAHLELARYRCPDPTSTRIDEAGEIIWDWHHSYCFLVHVQGNAHALEHVLWKARALVAEYHARQMHELELQAAAKAQALQKQWNEAQEKSEEEQLLESIKKDPAALLLMKALVLIQQERSCFTAEIENANFAAESNEGRLSEKLRNVRHELTNAKQEVKDERRRKEDLQADLDKIEKKAKRGW